jgi:hypothetical protein
LDRIPSWIKYLRHRRFLWLIFLGTWVGIIFTFTSVVSYLSLKFNSSADVKGKTRSMAEFIPSLQSFSLPGSFDTVLVRVKSNLARFQMNYLLIVVGCAALSIVTSPLSLTCAVLGTVAVYVSFNQTQRLMGVLANNIWLKITAILLLILFSSVVALSIVTYTTLMGLILVLFHLLLRDERVGVKDLGSNPSDDGLDERGVEIAVGRRKDARGGV